MHAASRDWPRINTEPEWQTQHRPTGILARNLCSFPWIISRLHPETPKVSACRAWRRNTRSGPPDGPPSGQIRPLHEERQPNFLSCSPVTADVAESPLVGWGRADAQPQFPQLQNGPVNLVQLPGLHVCGLLARTLGSVNMDIIQEPCSQLAWLLMQQDFTVATGLRGEEEAGTTRFDKWLLFTHDWQTNAPRCAANHLKITAHMFPPRSVPC